MFFDSGLADPEPTPGSAGDASPPPGITPSPIFDPSESAFAHRFSPSEATPSAPHAPAFVSAPDTRVPFSIKNNLLCPAPLSLQEIRGREIRGGSPEFASNDIDGKYTTYDLRRKYGKLFRSYGVSMDPLSEVTIAAQLKDYVSGGFIVNRLAFIRQRAGTQGGPWGMPGLLKAWRRRWSGG